MVNLDPNTVPRHEDTIPPPLLPPREYLELTYANNSVWLKDIVMGNVEKLGNF